ncbi:MAG TPA: adenylate/guanylate cyclase domain-containing protein [Verrucomicrobiae bacterium]|nr:adenylate/guanylate cyclase domain-containing protein [Verrucomicrobiae bacterium]
MRCGRCGEENREGRKFCAGCGAELGWACPDCSFVNEAGAGFCGGCGKAQPEAKPAPAAEQASASPSPEVVGERRQVAILFADLSGFTALSARLDAEDLRRLVEAFYARTEAIISLYGGSVDKHIGDAVMALFGAPVAHGDDNQRALGAALDIAATASEIAEPGGAPLAAHVGIAMGEVVAGGIGRGYTVLGDAVNLASRLVGLAGPGEVVIAEALQRQLEGRIRAVALPPASLKGIALPVVAWRVEGLEAARRPTSPYVGRETDRRLLAGLLEDCRRDGRGRVIVLRGEAGIGKSRLIEETITEARGRGFAVHKALVLDFGAGKGLDARGLLTRSLLGLSPDSDEAARRAAAEKAAASDLLRPEERATLQDLLALTAEGEARQLMQAMDEATRQARRRAFLAGLVTRLAGQRPTLVAIEDLHWAEPLLLEDLAALGQATAAAPLLLALSTRPEGDPLDRAWRAKVGPASISTIDLAPLSAAESALLARAHLESGDRRIAACIERAGGNPFFLEQLLHHTGEMTGASVPASVQSLVLGRADLLPPGEKHALRAASALGQRMPIEALRHLLGDAGYEPAYLVDQQFMRREGSELAFVHALVRDGIYGSLLKTRRRELHRAAAAWYGPRDLALGAQHLELGEDPGAADAYRAAAEAAAADYRSELALDLASRGLALAAAPATRVALANLSGELLQGLGRTEEAVTAFRAALKDAALGRPRLRAWLGLAQGLSVLDRLDEASALLAEAEAEAKARDVAADGMAVELSRLHTLRANIHFPRGEIERCLAEHSEALRLAEAAGAGEEQARALGGLADAYYMRGLYRTTEQMFRRCVDLSAAQGFKRIEAANLSMLAIMMFFELRFSEALAVADRGVALADQIGHRRAAMIAHHARFFLCFDTGELAEARRSVDAALEIAEALRARRFIAEGLFFRALLEQATGDARARDTLEEGNAIAREHPFYLLPLGLALLATMTADAQKRTAALAEGETLIATGAVSHNIPLFNRYAIEACLAAKDWSGAERYAAALLAGMAAEPRPMTDFIAARARALAAVGRGQGDAAEISRLLAEVRRTGWHAMVPALEAALR